MTTAEDLLPPTVPTRAELNAELDGMRQIVVKLETFDDQARGRILRWLYARYPLDVGF